MFWPTVRHMPWNTGVEPVKWMPARSGWASTASPMSRPEPSTMLMTPGGSPASSYSCMRKWAEYTAVDAGLNTTVLPISAGAVGRLPEIAVKLNGATANTKPSRGRY